VNTEGQHGVDVSASDSESMDAYHQRVLLYFEQETVTSSLLEMVG